MTENQENVPEVEQPERDAEAKSERFPELAELEEKIQRRLRSNQRFLDRFMDEDFDEMADDEDVDSSNDEDEDDPALMEEL